MTSRRDSRRQAMESYAPILGMIVAVASSILLVVSISGLIYPLRPRSRN